MDKMSFTGNISGENLAFGTGAKIQINKINITKDRTDSREKIMKELDRLEKLIAENKDRLDNINLLKQDIYVLRKEFNQEPINKNTIETKLNRLESGTKSVANIASAVSIIKTILFSLV